MKLPKWLKYVSFFGLIMTGIAAGLYWRIFIQPPLTLQPGKQQAPEHILWTTELQKYVTPAGWVNYADWQQDTLGISQYLQLLSASLPSESWTQEEQLAYWINAYNAFTVKLILDHYPLQSIQELHDLPLIGTIFHKEWFSLGDESMSLNRIEHGILRGQFEEPRIHAAINCASISCPALWNQAYTAEKLDQQLNRAMRTFINDSLRNHINEEEVEVSAIFSWFRLDFTQAGSLISFLNQYLSTPLKQNTDVSYLTYDWSLNETQTKPY